MDEPELLARVDANYFRSWSLLTGGGPGSEIVEQDGLILAAGVSRSSAFNFAYLWQSPRPLAERIELARAYFRAKERRYLVRFRAGAVPGIEEALREAGYECSDSGDIPSMVLVPAKAPPPSTPLEIVTCRTGTGLDDWAKTMSPGYGVSRDLATSFTAPVRSGMLDYELYLGLLEGEPVATSGLVLSHGVAGVYVVSTLPLHRRKGFGAEMTWHAVRRGAQLGARIASLQPSPMGQRLYESMGFRHAGVYRTYEPLRSVA